MPNTTFIDSHCHLDFDDFAKDRALVIEQAKSQNIKQIVIPGVAPNQWPQLQAMCSQNTSLYFACGLHPWWLKEIENTSSKPLASISEYLKHPKCVAIGETGLDANTDFAMEKQIESLKLHLNLAEQHHLPIILHCVKAHNELIKTLKDLNFSGRGVVHAFAGSFEIAQSYWQMGLHLGVGGTITYERAKKTRDAIQQIPMEALLLETDAPSMPLCGEQGERNSPLNVIRIAQTLAELKQCSVQEVASTTTSNARSVFSKLVH